MMILIGVKVSSKVNNYLLDNFVEMGFKTKSDFIRHIFVTYMDDSIGLEDDLHKAVSYLKKALKGDKCAFD